MFPLFSDPENPNILNNQLQFVTNPHSFEIEGLKIVGTNGSNIRDMRMYCEGLKESPLEALEQTLKMRIMYPTCPDTLRCYPVKQDPFIIYKSPNVYFCGNQPKFETKMLESGTRLICVPSFRRTK